MIGYDKEIKYSCSGISQIIQLHFTCTYIHIPDLFAWDDRYVFNNLYLQLCLINFRRYSWPPDGLLMIQAPVMCAHRNVRSTWHDRSEAFIYTARASSCISLLISLAEDNLITLHFHVLITWQYTANMRYLPLPWSQSSRRLIQKQDILFAKTFTEIWW